MNILDTIISKKKMEVEQLKLSKSVSELENGPFFDSTVIDFKQYLVRSDRNGIIAEFKRRSPSKGTINDKATVTEVTTAYAKYGAGGISVLTDEEFFGGSINDLLESDG